MTTLGGSEVSTKFSFCLKSEWREGGCPPFRGRVPRGGLEPPHSFQNCGFWVRRVSQFRHLGFKCINTLRTLTFCTLQMCGICVVRRNSIARKIQFVNGLLHHEFVGELTVVNYHGNSPVPWVFESQVAEFHSLQGKHRMCGVSRGIESQRFQHVSVQQRNHL